MRRSLFALILVSFCQSGFSSDDITLSPEALQCDGIKPADVPTFSQLAEASAAINRGLCEAIFNPLGERSRAELATANAQWRDTLQDFAKSSRVQALRIKKVVSIENFDRPFAQLQEKLNQGDIYSMSLPGFSVDRGSDGSVIFHFNDRAESARIEFSDNEACQPHFNATCSELLKDYGRAFIGYKSAYSKITTDQALDQISELSAEWREFLASARSQTFFDLGFTTWRETNHFKQGYLVGPPSRQWFFLHPNVVYEHVSDAPDGFKTKPGIAFEIVGINYWKKEYSPLPWPFGMSIAGSFIERPETDDVGIGLMFHIDNRYSFGFSHYDEGKYGVYLTIDLLNAVNNKRDVFENYRSRMLD